MLKITHVYAVVALAMLHINGVHAEVLWECDLSTSTENLFFTSSMLWDCQQQRVVVHGTSEMVEGKPGETTVWRWDVSTSGTVIASHPVDELPARIITTNISTAYDHDSGEIVLLAKLPAHDETMMIVDQSGISIVVDMQAVQNQIKSSRGRIGAITVGPGGTVILTGGVDGNGKLMAIDQTGSVIWEAISDLGPEDEFLSDVVYDSAAETLYTVGHMFKPAINLSMMEPMTICLQKWDCAGRMIDKALMKGGKTFWDPRVLQLASGNLAVVHDRGTGMLNSQLWVGVYTPDLELLWEREVVGSGEMELPVVFYDLCQAPGEGFAVAASVDVTKIEVHQFDGDGELVHVTRMGGEVGLAPICVDWADGKIILACATMGKEGEKFNNLRVIALQPADVKSPAASADQ